MVVYSRGHGRTLDNAAKLRTPKEAILAEETELQTTEPEHEGIFWKTEGLIGSD